MELLFKIANICVIPCWILLAFFPKKKITKRLLFSHLFPIILAIFYMSFILWGMYENYGKNGGMDSMASLRISFLNDKVLLAAWIHYLVFDLFVGIWIAKDNLAKNRTTLPLIPILALTLFFGPIGFLCYKIYDKIKS